MSETTAIVTSIIGSGGLIVAMLGVMIRGMNRQFTQTNQLIEDMRTDLKECLPRARVETPPKASLLKPSFQPAEAWRAVHPRARGLGRGALIALPSSIATIGRTPRNTAPVPITVQRAACKTPGGLGLGAVLSSLGEHDCPGSPTGYLVGRTGGTPEVEVGCFDVFSTARWDTRG